MRGTTKRKIELGRALRATVPLPCPKPESVARVLTVQERVLLFCVGSGTDLLRAGVTGHTVQVGIVKGIVIRDGQDQQLALTELGRKVLAGLLQGAGLELAAAEDATPSPTVSGPRQPHRKRP